LTKELKEREEKYKRDLEAMQRPVEQFEILSEKNRSLSSKLRDCEKNLRNSSDKIRCSLSENAELRDKLRNSIIEVNDLKIQLDCSLRENEEKSDLVVQLQALSRNSEQKSIEADKRNSQVSEKLIELNKQHKRDSIKYQKDCEQKDKELNKLLQETGRLRKSISEKEKQFHEQLSSQEDKWQKSLKCREQVLTKELKEREEKYKRDLEALQVESKRELENEIKCLKQQHSDEVAKLKTEFEFELKREKDNFECRLKQATENNERQISIIKEDYRRSEDYKDKENYRKLRNSEEALQHQLDLLREDCKRQIENERKKYEQILCEQKEINKQKLISAQKKFESEVKAVNEKEKEQEEQFEKRLTIQERSVKSRLLLQAEKFNEEKRELKEKVSKAKKEAEQLRHSLQSSTSIDLKQRQKKKRRLIGSSFCDMEEDFFNLLASTSLESLPSLSRRGRRRKRSRPVKRRKRPVTSSPILKPRLNLCGRRSLSACRIGLSNCSPNKEIIQLRKRVRSLETRADCMKTLLKLRQDEVAELQKAHDKRLNRLQELTTENKKIMKLVEQNCPRKKVNKCLNEIDKPLNINNDDIWNEFAILKHNFKRLKLEKMLVEDCVDQLNVERSNDKAKIQELKIMLKNQLKYKPTPFRKKSKIPLRALPIPSGYSSANLHSEEDAEDLISILKREKQDLQSTVSYLRNDIKSLRCDVTDAREKEMKIREECEMLRRHDDTRRQENEDLKDQIKKLEQKCEDLKDQMKRSDERCKNLKDQIKTSEERCKKLKDQINWMKDEDFKKKKGLMKSRKQRIMKSSNKKLQSTRRFQKMLNKSIFEMKKLFGDQFNDVDQYETLSTLYDLSQIKSSSDLSSLGQLIKDQCQKNNESEWNNCESEDESNQDQKTISTTTRKKPVKKRMLNNCSKIELHHRLLALKRQYETIRNDKIILQNKLDEEINKNQGNNNEITNYQNKCKSHKQSLLRLQKEIEHLRELNENLSAKLEAETRSKPNPRFSDADYKLLETKLKTANHNNLKLSIDLQHIKDDLVQKEDQIKLDKDKIARLERDVTMKRHLIEELRHKMKEEAGSRKEEDQKKIEAVEKISALECDVTHKKNQIESLRKQLQAVTSEKTRYEAIVDEVKQEGKIAMQKLRDDVTEAERRAKRVGGEAQTQMTQLAARSSEAIDQLQQKMETDIKCFSNFVMTMASKLLEEVVRARDSFYDVKLEMTKQK